MRRAADMPRPGLERRVTELERRVARVEAGMLFDMADGARVLGTWARLKEAAAWWEEWFEEMERRCE